MNLIALVGNVASTDELENVDGTSTHRFRVAVSRPGDAETADFFDVVTFDRQAEATAQYLAIGRRIAVEGRLNTTTHSKHAAGVRIVASRVELLSGRPST